MYRSFILPHLEFSDVVWDNCTIKQAEDIEQIQLDALRTITGSVRGTSHQKLYTETGFTCLKERRQRHKTILYYKIVKGSVPTYLIDRLPHLTASINPYHRRFPLERQVPRCRLELYKSSYFPSTTVLWNSLPEHIKRSDSIGVLKRFLSRDDSTVPPHYYLPDRQSEIIICKLRLEMSDLNNDLCKRHIANNSACSCNAPVEDACHFLIHCPLFQQIRAQTIDLLPDDVKTNVSLLLFGSCDRNLNDNRTILESVGNFIQLSNRFTN